MNDAVRLTTTPGYIACACCGVDIIGVSGDKCGGCKNGDGEGAGEGCDMTTTWHCFTAHCDGSGCTYPGECEENGDTFRDYYALDRVKVFEAVTGKEGSEGTVTVGRMADGRVCVKPDGWDHTVNISPIYVAPLQP
ncbi:hypothetical protein ACIOHC_36245 [Streptomyces sp. NPDC088252]|uniref:hypothetical protein n=1 Tax=Streptomyces sp. NPDC088252 TaxID=3365845 RepID=UPI003824B902